MQNAWLLYNGGNDAGLYRQLLTLGGRTDLTDEQRRTVQTIWANWAVRRANQTAATGQTQKALAILNATARSFPDNPGVVKALAGGYQRAGLSKQAVLIWKAQDMTSAPASDYKAAVGAALAAGDSKSAETWLRFGLEQYPKDPDILNLAAKFEQARGDNGRAVDYYKASIDASPAPDPGAELATELSRPVPAAYTQLPGSPRAAPDLATLLAPGTEAAAGTPAQTPSPSSQPYLPSYGSIGGAPVQMNQDAGQATDPAYPLSPAVPSYMTNPQAVAPAPSSTPRTRLRDYVPQAAVDEPLPADATALPGIVVATHSDPGALILTPAVYQQQQIARATAGRRRA